VVRNVESVVGIYSAISPAIATLHISEKSRFGEAGGCAAGDNKVIKQPMSTRLKASLFGTSCLTPRVRSDRVGGELAPAALPHHRTCGSAYGGS